jgi:hypothetical protein
MGFLLNITCNFSICSETGKPYYLETNDGKLKKVYGIPDITVPQQFRPFLQQFGGPYFHAYTTSRISEEYSHITSMSALAFLDQYPAWTDVTIDLRYHAEDGWTRKDHDDFKKALEWFSQQSVDYTVNWSY